MMVVVGLTSAFFSWLGFSGVDEANDDIRPSVPRIGVTLGFMGLAALGAALVCSLPRRAFGRYSDAARGNCWGDGNLIR
jgi:hypothetical protein